MAASPFATTACEGEGTTPSPHPSLTGYSGRQVRRPAAHDADGPRPAALALGGGRRKLWRGASVSGIHHTFLCKSFGLMGRPGGNRGGPFLYAATGCAADGAFAQPASQWRNAT